MADDDNNINDPNQMGFDFRNNSNRSSRTLNGVPVGPAAELSRRYRLMAEKIQEERDTQEEIAQEKEFAGKFSEAAVHRSEIAPKLIGQRKASIATNMAESLETMGAYRNVNSRTTTQSSSAELFSQIRGGGSEILRLPTKYLQEQVSTIQQEIQGEYSSLAKMARENTRTDATPEMTEKSRLIAEKEEQAAMYKAAQKMQIHEGLSTQKKTYAYEDLRERIENRKETGLIRDEARSGQFDLKKEESKLFEALDKLTAEFEKAEKASEAFTLAVEKGASAEDQARLKKEAIDADIKREQAQEAAEKQKKRVEIGQQYGGDGNRISTASGLAGVFSPMAQAYQTGFINQEITDMRQKAQFAGMAVNQYNMGRSALAGDMHAMMQLESEYLVTNFADNMGERQALADTMNLTAQGLDVAGRAGKDTLGLAGKVVNPLEWGNVGDDAWQAGADVSSGAAGLIVQGQAMAKQINTGETTLQAAAAAKDFVAQITAIPAQSRQALFDQFAAANQGVTGLGGGAMAAQKVLTSFEYQDKAAALGFSGQQMAALTGMAANQVGGAEDKTAIALRAAAAQRNKLMSAEQYVGNLGVLSGVGGKSEDLEEIMKTAVASGMDNSKNIAQMVHATAQMSAGMAKYGMAGGKEIDEMMGASYQRLQAAGIDENLRVGMTMTAMEKQREMYTESGMDLGSIGELAGLSKIDPRMTSGEKRVIQKMLDPAAIQKIVGTKDPAMARAEAEKLGLGDMYDRIGKEGFIQIEREKQLKMARNMDLHLYAKNPNQLNSPLKEMDPEMQRFMMASGFFSKAGTYAGETGTKGVIKEYGDDIERQKRFQREQEMGMQKDAAAAFGGDPAKAMEAIVTTLGEISKNLDPAKMQQKAKAAAETKEELQPLTQAASSLVRSANALETIAGLFVNRFGKPGEVLETTMRSQYPASKSKKGSTGSWQ